MEGSSPTKKVRILTSQTRLAPSNQLMLDVPCTFLGVDVSDVLPVKFLDFFFLSFVLTILLTFFLFRTLSLFFFLYILFKLITFLFAFHPTDLRKRSFLAKKILATNCSSTHCAWHSAVPQGTDEEIIGRP